LRVPPTNSYRYDPCGSPLVASGTAYYPFQYISAYRHSGLANLDHMGARYYQPSRFTQLDPHPKKLLTVNRYAYARCDPVINSDPSGLDHCGDQEFDWYVAVAGYGLAGVGVFAAVFATPMTLGGSLLAVSGFALGALGAEGVREAFDDCLAEHAV
jgi:RHS repeat-associated protein